jgi:hypothetical protein
MSMQPGPCSRSLFLADMGEGAEREIVGSNPFRPKFMRQKFTLPILGSLPPSLFQKRAKGEEIYNSILISWYVTLHTEIAFLNLRVPLGKIPVNFIV